MRATKKQLQDEIDAARRLSKMKLVVVTPRQELALRDDPSFVPVGQYGIGSHAMLPCEIGRCSRGFRYLEASGMLARLELAK